jgi:PTH1 family peptidyl-tRNA hydrolase
LPETSSYKSTFSWYLDVAKVKMVAHTRNFASNFHRNNGMKYLITGLGNIGYEYDGTRHNIGFEVVDHLCKELGGEWKGNTHGDLAEVKFKGRTLILLKPNTYMNLSGKAIRYWLQKEKIPVENSVVVLDDLNLEFSKQRLRAKGSDGGHNGLKSIQELLGTDAYPRLRIGIGSSFSKGKQVNFVLGKWSEDEKAELSRILEKSAEVIKTFVTIGLEKAMNATGK